MPVRRGRRAATRTAAAWVPGRPRSRRIGSDWAGSPFGDLLAVIEDHDTVHHGIRMPHDVSTQMMVTPRSLRIRGADRPAGPSLLSRRSGPRRRAGAWGRTRAPGELQLLAGGAEASRSRAVVVAPPAPAPAQPPRKARARAGRPGRRSRRARRSRRSRAGERARDLDACRPEMPMVIFDAVRRQPASRAASKRSSRRWARGPAST